MIKCALCGYEFDEKAMACHSQCPMSEGCAIICCPNCGYQVVDESKTWGAMFLRKAWARWRSATAKPTPPIGHSAATPLTGLTAGQSAEVVEIASADAGRLHRLSVLGIAPGSMIRLAQQSPVCIIWVDETQVSLDNDVAQEILCK